ncbi:TetR/AcrR family transcriptional regulator [Mycolicibacterium arseniciresistens]|uniref:TetR family transcriptional regulator n=1 Tax=Mycolicibacterium arseniciresistens TaxID=3062257 RepID=A0ABT8UFZ3_9MYCO|nr:TetR family transcriptional regulator [Mycolicibacterium arseniciresistens]MDO3635997.1 TetR family transcriptional regulator [Mycolicibacterium arseniciresistens]
MAREDWVVGGDRRAAAADRIYAAATDLALRDGLDAFDIETLAGRVHCSRATVYRYAGGKSQIRDAVLMRLAAGVVDTVRCAVEGLSGHERVLTAITVALAEMRSEPLRRLMAGSKTMSELGELQSSPALAHIAAELTGLTDDPQAAVWVVHVVLSLVYLPLGDPAVEHDMLRRIVSPGLSAAGRCSAE